MAKPLIAKAQPVRGPGRVRWDWRRPLENRGGHYVPVHEGSIHMNKGSNPTGAGSRPGFLSVQDTPFEAEIKLPLPKATCVHSNYWGVLHAVWETKICNYSNARQLFSAQEVGQLTPSLRSPYYS